jgi:AcrR family transcriptional regulator
VNQKRRTRAAIVGAAKELLSEGVTPTVGDAAQRALVSRTTAYRYFPTQEALLLEVAVTTDVAEIEALVAEPVDRDEVPDRLREVIRLLNRHVLDDEAQYRAAMRTYLDLWAAAKGRGEDDPVVREGRRTRWIDSVLDRLEGSIPRRELDRLRAALALVTGSEAMIALRDVARLDADEAVDVADWAAATLIAAVLDRR